MEIDVLENVSAPEVNAEELRRTLANVLHTAGEIEAELAVSLVDDAAIRRLSSHYLQRDSATDVLAFPQRNANQPNDRHLGDIVISMDAARRQAAGWRHSVDAEVRHLAEHGLLHLFGHEHDEANGAEWNEAARRLGLPHHVLNTDNME